MPVQKNLKYLKMTHSSYYEGLPINASQDNPSYISILDKTYRELSMLIAMYSRTVIVRIDLHPGIKGKPLEVSMTDFCRSFQQKLEYDYGSKVAYQWVQESGKQDRNKGVHWHLWVGVKNKKDHQPKRQARDMYEIIVNAWSKHTKGQNERHHKSGWFYIERNKTQLVTRKEQQLLISQGGAGLLFNVKAIEERTNNKFTALGGVIDECFYTLSYLAKVYSKVRTPSMDGKRLSGCTKINYRSKAIMRQDKILQNLVDINTSLQQKLLPLLLEHP